MNAGNNSRDAAVAATTSTAARNKRDADGDSRPPHPFTESFAPRPTWQQSTNYVVDKLKLQAASNQKNLANIKLTPPQWTSPKSQQAPATSNISISKNMYSVLENLPANPTPVKDTSGSDSVGATRSSSSAPVLTPSEPPTPNVPQELLPDDKFRKLKPIVDLTTLINPDDEEFRLEILQFETKYHAAVMANILNIVVGKTVKDVNTLAKSIVHLVTTNTISLENFEAGLKETLEIAPDLYIDIPKFYDNIGIIISSHIEKQHITLAKTFGLCGTVIAANQGHLLLKAIIHNLKESMGRAFVKTKWQESGLQLSQWMNEEQLINACGGNSRGDGGTGVSRWKWGLHRVDGHKHGRDSRRQPFRMFPRPIRHQSTNHVNLADVKLAPPKWASPKSQQAPVTSGPDSVGATRSSSSAPVLTPSEPPTPNVPQELLPDDKFRKLKPIVDLTLINPDDEEFRLEILQFETKYHAAVMANILNIVVEKTAKDVNTLAKSIVHLVTTNTISLENFEAGLKETLEIAPDLYIDIPKFYDNIGIIISSHIEKKHITLAKTFGLCGTVIAANQGHLLLKAIIHNLKESMGHTFVKIKWRESELQLSQWMNEEQVPQWIVDNKFKFLAGDGSETHYQANEDSVIKITPAETQSRLLQLMNSDESCECVKGWVQDKLGKAHNEDWFMRTLIQAICDYALSGNEGRDVPHFNQDRMSKYVGLIYDFGNSKESREANCLFGIQHLIHRLKHPEGLTLEIFQYLHEQYIIALDGFLAWEESDKEPEGKGAMLLALTSFLRNIKEAVNEDSDSD